MKLTSTPLASIFGSGFLIIVPILASVVGKYSTFVMAGICLLAYCVGSVIRFNIKHVETILEQSPSKSTIILERISDIAIVIAYIISVCLYLHIMSAFILSELLHDTILQEDVLTTASILVITLIGITKGLKQLEFLEQFALLITFLIIFLLMIGFSHYDWHTWKLTTNFILPTPVKHTSWEIITIIAGTLIVVQGFETTRYLGSVYPRQDRIRASRWAQVIATVVYLLFVALTLPVLHTLNGQYNDDSLIALTMAASSILVIPLVAAASLSQFSAAVADMLAASGNLKEISQEKVKEKWSYMMIGGTAIILTWTADTFELVSLASRAFAFYYMTQCFIALTVSQSLLQKILLASLSLILGFITIFAVPAS